MSRCIRKEFLSCVGRDDFCSGKKGSALPGNRLELAEQPRRAEQALPLYWKFSLLRINRTLRPYALVRIICPRTYVLIHAGIPFFLF